MSQFSDYIDGYINEKGITVAKLAAKMNIDRSILFRYVKGKRVPEDEKIVKNIAYNLCMSISEMDRLIEYYDRLVCGDEKVDNFLYFKNFLRGLRDRENEFAGKTNLWKVDISCDDNPDRMWINSGEELLLMIRYIFAGIAGDALNSRKVYIITQSTNDALQRGIRFCFNGTDVAVEHIVCLEKREELRYKNLDVLLDIITTSFADINYTSWYYYRNNSEMYEFDWLPNVIITDDCVIQFDSNMQSGTCVKGAEYAKGALTKYNSIRKATVNLSRGLLFGDYTSNLDDDEYNVDYQICANLMYEPCLIYAVGADMLRTNMVDIHQKESYLKYREHIGGVWNDLEFTPSEFLLKQENPVIRFQRKGLIKFMETGCSCEFPHMAYRPFDMSQRIMILKRLIELSKKNIFNIMMIDESVDLPEKVFMYRMADSGGLQFGIVNDVGTKFFYVSESGFQYSFDMFMEELERKGLVLYNEESRKVMEEVCLEYSGRG